MHGEPPLTKARPHWRDHRRRAERAVDINQARLILRRDAWTDFLPEAAVLNL